MSTTRSDRLRNRLAPSRQSVQGLALLFAIVVLMWLLEGINALDSHGLDYWGGLVPRRLGDLWAVFTAPFLHYNFQHLIDNTVPFVFMGVIIALRGALRLAVVTLIVIVVSGVGTWLIAPAHTSTVGASGIVFGYATYLLTRGIFDRSLLEVLTGIVVGVVWGGALAASIVPHNGVSWQAHACGAIGGVVAAWLLAGRDRSHTATGGRGGPGRGGGNGRPGSTPRSHAELQDALDRALSH